MFFAYGYSTPQDTIKRQNSCPNGFLIQVNGEFHCIDTTISYYPICPGDEEIDLYPNMLKSINLKILKESKWYNEDIQGNRLRIFLIAYPPSFDSIVVYSFLDQNQDHIKLIKKKMPIFDNIGFCATNPLNPFEGYLFFDTKKEISSVNYAQTEFIIPKRKLNGLIKQLHALKNCETFDRYSMFPEFVIEYFFEGDYHLLISTIPSEWYRMSEQEKNCRRKNGLKIMEWLNNY